MASNRSFRLAYAWSYRAFISACASRRPLRYSARAAFCASCAARSAMVRRVGLFRYPSTASLARSSASVSMSMPYGFSTTGTLASYTPSTASVNAVMSVFSASKVPGQLSASSACIVSQFPAPSVSRTFSRPNSALRTLPHCRPFLPSP